MMQEKYGRRKSVPTNPGLPYPIHPLNTIMLQEFKYLQCVYICVGVVKKHIRVAQSELDLHWMREICKS